MQVHDGALCRRACTAALETRFAADGQPAFVPPPHTSMDGWMACWNRVARGSPPPSSHAASTTPIPIQALAAANTTPLLAPPHHSVFQKQIPPCTMYSRCVACLHYCWRPYMYGGMRGREGRFSRFQIF